MAYKPTRKELLELIESMEAGGGDATEFRSALEELEPEVKRMPQTQRNSRFREEEETTEERLVREIGYLFPDGIPYKEIYDGDRDFTLAELKAQCRKAGLSIGGQKKLLVGRLIANKTMAKGPDNEVHIVREATEHLKSEEVEAYHLLPKEVSFPVLFKEVWAAIDDDGSVNYSYFPSAGVGHIEIIWVPPSVRRRGFGRKLLQFAIDDMQKKGITLVSTNIWSKEGESLFKTFDFHYAGTGTFALKKIA